MRLGTGVIGGRAAHVVFTANANTSSNGTNRNFTVNFGDEAPGRKIIFAVISYSGLGTTPSSVAIAGQSPTLVAQSTNRLRLYIADVPTGASGNINVQYGTTSSGTSVMVWAAYGLKNATAYDTRTATMAIGVASADLSINTRSGGIVLAATEDGANGTSTTWSGVVMDFQNTSTINNWVRSGASANVKNGESPRAITVASSNTSSTRNALAASFR